MAFFLLLGFVRRIGGMVAESVFNDTFAYDVAFEGKLGADARELDI